MATEQDRIWPKENWPALRFKEALKMGAKGGHGPIRYFVEAYNPNEIISTGLQNPRDLMESTNLRSKNLPKIKPKLVIPSKWIEQEKEHYLGYLEFDLYTMP